MAKKKTQIAKAARFNDLVKTETNEHHKAIFEILARHEGNGKVTQDGYGQIVLDASELDSIKEEMSAIVQDARAEAGDIQTATEMRQRLISDFPAKLRAQVEERLAREKLLANPGIVQDGDYANPETGIGTAIDPGMKVESFIPVSILPGEATAYYAGGGIPARIINKKAGCLSLDGIHFECPDMDPDDITALEAYAEECGFYFWWRDFIPGNQGRQPAHHPNDTRAIKGQDRQRKALY